MSKASTELRAKIHRVRRFLEEESLDAVILASPANFAWITGGASQRIEIRGDEPAAALVARENLSHTPAIVLRGSGSCRALPAAARRCPKGAIAADVPLPNTAPLRSDFRRLHAPLLAGELERYRGIGRDLEVCITWAAFNVRPGLTRETIRGMVAGQMMAMAIEPARIVVAVDGSARMQADAPGAGARLRDHLRISVCGRRHGLHVAMTRLISFAGLSVEALRCHAAAQRAAAAMITATRPGAAVDAIPTRGSAGLEAGGFAGAAERTLRLRGGAIGYLLPQESGHAWLAEWLRGWRDEAPDSGRADAVDEEIVGEAQAYSWRVDFGSSCCEDTFIVTSNGPELLTATRDLPADVVEIDGVPTPQAAILVR